MTGPGASPSAGGSVSRTRIVLADDHALFRETLGDLLNAQPTLTVVGHAADGAEVVRCVAAAQPDVLLLDLHMPHSHGANTVRDIIRASPRTRILCLSAYAESYLVDEVLAAGARGFLHKGIDRAALLTAIERSLTEPRRLTVLVPGGTAARVPLEEPLSRREHQVLVGAASAKSNRQIADWLDITEGTVKRHLNSVFRKLGAVSRLDAVNKAVRASLIPAPAIPVAAARRSPGRRLAPETAADPAFHLSDGGGTP
ncbi:response regulator transcription factor [Streptomyces jumonjinensis]|uniref:Response regulator transcription factor n=1 Tax=Streptomyces jumonjinensis TaxID=1945 RepID=A0A646KWV8_STRJU|nr:response regulator transcription factor [Streptomyces jumonjinensis]MQT05496.1 response regulator transcription factor [Streptomyces jumonjinensis]